jgi:hypothetical protein
MATASKGGVGLPNGETELEVRAAGTAAPLATLKVTNHRSPADVLRSAAAAFV